MVTNKVLEDNVLLCVLFYHPDRVPNLKTIGGEEKLILLMERQAGWSRADPNMAARKQRRQIGLEER